MFKVKGSTLPLTIHEVKFIASSRGVAITPGKTNMALLRSVARAAKDGLTVTADFKGRESRALRTVDDKFISAGGLSENDREINCP
jgi:hypothetical protein